MSDLPWNADSGCKRQRRVAAIGNQAIETLRRLAREATALQEHTLADDLESAAKGLDQDITLTMRGVQREMGYVRPRRWLQLVEVDGE